MLIVSNSAVPHINAHFILVSRLCCQLSNHIMMVTFHSVGRFLKSKEFLVTSFNLSPAILYNLVPLNLKILLLSCSLPVFKSHAHQSEKKKNQQQLCPIAIAGKRGTYIAFFKNHLIQFLHCYLNGTPLPLTYFQRCRLKRIHFIL